MDEPESDDGGPNIPDSAVEANKEVGGNGEEDASASEDEEQERRSKDDNKDSDDYDYDEDEEDDVSDLLGDDDDDDYSPGGGSGGGGRRDDSDFSIRKGGFKITVFCSILKLLKDWPQL